MASKFFKIPRTIASNNYSLMYRRCCMLLRHFDNTAPANKMLYSTKMPRMSQAAPEYIEDYSENKLVTEEVAGPTYENIISNEEKVSRYASKLKQIRMQLCTCDMREKYKASKTKCTEEIKRADDKAGSLKNPKKLPKLDPCICDCPERQCHTPTYSPKLKRLKPRYDDSHMKWRHKYPQKDACTPERMDDIRGYKQIRKKLPPYFYKKNKMSQ